MSEKRLVYVYDPLCGWCYGFSPVIQALHDATKRRASWEVLAGGMVMGEQVGPIGRLSEFLKQALPRVEGTTGVRFGQAFTTGVLEKGTLVLSSLEPSRALQAVKTVALEKAMPYAALLQSALYERGLDISSLGVLGDLAQEIGIAHFDIEYLKTETYDRTMAEFELVAGMGITGFPTLVGFDGEVGKVFSRGWAPFDRLFESVNRWLES